MKVFLLTALKAHSHSYALTIKMLVPTYHSTTRFLFCSSVVVFAKGIVGYPYYPSSPHSFMPPNSKLRVYHRSSSGRFTCSNHFDLLVYSAAGTRLVTAFAVRTCLSHSIRSAHVSLYSAPSFQPCCYYSGADGLSLRRQCTCSSRCIRGAHVATQLGAHVPAPLVLCIGCVAPRLLTPFFVVQQTHF